MSTTAKMTRKYLSNSSLLFIKLNLPIRLYRTSIVISSEWSRDFYGYASTTKERENPSQAASFSENRDSQG
jgi:hypothetical protein